MAIYPDGRGPSLSRWALSVRSRAYNGRQRHSRPVPRPLLPLVLDFPFESVGSPGGKKKGKRTPKERRKENARCPTVTCRHSAVPAFAVPSSPRYELTATTTTSVTRASRPTRRIVVIAYMSSGRSTHGRRKHIVADNTRLIADLGCVTSSRVVRYTRSAALEDFRRIAGSPRDGRRSGAVVEAASGEWLRALRSAVLLVSCRLRELLPAARLYVSRARNTRLSDISAYGAVASLCILCTTARRTKVISTSAILSITPREVDSEIPRFWIWDERGVPRSAIEMIFFL